MELEHRYFLTLCKQKNMLIDDFNTTLDIWLKELQNYNYKSLTQKQDASSWSIGQVYMHLINETNWYFEQLECCFSHTNNIEKEMAESAKFIFENNSFAAIKILGDPLISEHVPQPKNLDSIEKELLSLKSKAAKLWLRINSDEPQGKTEHPGIEFLSPSEWLQYSEMHMRHHLKQKKRIVTYLNLNNITHIKKGL